MPPSRILFKALKWFLVGAFTTAAILLALIFYEFFLWSPLYDDDDPRHAPLVRQLSEIGKALRQGNPTSATLDLTSLNNGDWVTACVFGGYNDPLNAMEKKGAEFSSGDKRRLLQLGKRGMRLAQVEESEVLFVYMDATGRARYVHFEYGFGPEGQHFERCISKPVTRIQLSQPNPSTCPTTAPPGPSRSG